MSNSIKAVLMLGLVTLSAACAQQEEVVIVEPEPIMAEPASEKF